MSLDFQSSIRRVNGETYVLRIEEESFDIKPRFWFTVIAALATLTFAVMSSEKRNVFLKHDAI